MLALIEVDERLEEPLLKGLLLEAYRCSRQERVLIVLPWTLRPLADRVLDDAVRALGLRVEGVAFEDPDSPELEDFAESASTVIATSAAFRGRMQALGIQPHFPAQGLKLLRNGGGLPRNPPPASGVLRSHKQCELSSSG